MKRLLSLWVCVLIICIGISFTAGATDNDGECLRWATPTPMPTAIPMSHIYTEWIPMPGTAPGTGHGWVRATELASAQRQWPPEEILTAHVLRDAEYNTIAEEHGVALTQGGKWIYGFPPRQGFPLLYGGVVLKNEWLPERLQ